MEEFLDEIGLTGRRGQRRDRGDPEEEKIVTGIHDIDAEELEPCELEPRSAMIALGEERHYNESECIICKHDDGSFFDDPELNEYQSFEKVHQTRMYEEIKKGFYAGRIVSTCKKVSNYFNVEVIKKPDETDELHALKRDINKDHLGLDVEEPKVSFPRVSAKLIYDHYWDHDESPELDDIKEYRQLCLIIKQKIRKGGIYKRRKGMDETATYFLDKEEDKTLKEWFKLKLEYKKRIEKTNTKKN